MSSESSPSGWPADIGPVGHSSPIVDPIVIVGAPRTGTSTLLALLSTHPGLWSLYTESQAILDGPLHPQHRAWESHVATEEDLDERLRTELPRQFYDRAGNLECLPLGARLPLRVRGRPRMSAFISLASRPIKPTRIRIVEKTIPNILRTRFMRALFPGTRILHLTREPRGSIEAMYRGWRDPIRHHDFPLPEGFRIPGHDRSYWSFVLPPGWRSQNGKSLIEVIAFQWMECHRRCLDDTASLDEAEYLRIRLEDLLADPVAVLTSVARWADIDPRPFLRFSRGLPRINAAKHAVPDPVPQPDVEAVLPTMADVAHRLGYG